MSKPCVQEWLFKEGCCKAMKHVAASGKNTVHPQCQRPPLQGEDFCKTHMQKQAYGMMPMQLIKAAEVMCY